MPRRIPTQVSQTVSRLLEGGYLKQQPAWYEATLRYPPAMPPPHQSVQRPDDDLPRSLQSHVRRQPHDAAAKAQGRSRLNMHKKLRSQLPALRPQPIVYEADRIRRQFFRDHPWEAKRPKTLVETDYVLDTQPEPTIPAGQLPELSMWSRMNPSVEDVIQCTLKTSEVGNMSLSKAYRRTIATYHAIQAEREHQIRYAVLEARAWGADLGPTETERGFIKERAELDKWASLSADLHLPEAMPASTASDATTAGRTKRTDGSFTAGAAYMTSATSVSRGEALVSSATETGAFSSASTADAATTTTSSSSDDYLGIGASLRS